MARDIYLSEGKLMGPDGHVDVDALANATFSPPKSLFVPATIDGITTTGSGTWSFTTNANSPFYAELAHTDGAVNDTITFPQVYLDAGTYTFALYYRAQLNCAIATVAIGGSSPTSLGGSTDTVDMYNAASSGVAAKSTITGIAIPTAGYQAVRLSLNSKNASSGGYFALLSAFTFARTA